MSKNKEIEVFGLSFMDLISCGLGGMLVMMFVFSTLVEANGSTQPAKEQREGKTTAQAQRELLFSTNFVLNASFDSYVEMEADEDDLSPLKSNFEFTSFQRDTSAYMFMVNTNDQVLESFRFKLGNYQSGGSVQLLGDQVSIIPDRASAVIVLKTGSKYSLRYE